MTELDETHDPARTSWIGDANGHPDFPVQNLPFCISSNLIDDQPRAGVAIGDHIVDIRAATEAGFLASDAAKVAAKGEALNAFLALPAEARCAFRRELSGWLSGPANDTAAARATLCAMDDCRFHLPARIGDYTDFYVGIHHAEAVGRLFRPDNPLLSNYKHVPIGYHGRASSVQVSDLPVARPCGQILADGAVEPAFAPCRRLDYELELGIWIGEGNRQGHRVPVSMAGRQIAGFSLLNDWSARDVQTWEYQPLGPFLAKSFVTSVSPWIVSTEALAPFRIAQAPRPAGDPHPLPYLWDDKDQAHGAFDIDLEVSIRTSAMRVAGQTPYRLAQSNARHMYWTAAQMIAHHTSNGCNLRPGDLLGTGTLSGPDASGCGSLLELVGGGKGPVSLPTGETRMFLEDGDEVILRASASREGFATIGLGECRGTITPAQCAGDI